MFKKIEVVGFLAWMKTDCGTLVPLRRLCLGRFPKIGSFI